MPHNGLTTSGHGPNAHDMRAARRRGWDRITLSVTSFTHSPPVTVIPFTAWVQAPLIPSRVCAARQGPLVGNFTASSSHHPSHSLSLTLLIGFWFWNFFGTDFDFGLWYCFIFLAFGIGPFSWTRISHLDTGFRILATFFDLTLHTVIWSNLCLILFNSV